MECSLPAVHKILQQEYQSGLPCPPPGDLPNPGIEPMSLTSPALADGFFSTSTTWEALLLREKSKSQRFLATEETWNFMIVLWEPTQVGWVEVGVRMTPGKQVRFCIFLLILRVQERHSQQKNLSTERKGHYKERNPLLHMDLLHCKSPSVKRRKGQNGSCHIWWPQVSFPITPAVHHSWAFSDASLHFEVPALV